MNSTIQNAVFFFFFFFSLIVVDNTTKGKLMNKLVGSLYCFGFCYLPNKSISREWVCYFVSMIGAADDPKITWGGWRGRARYFART